MPVEAATDPLTEPASFTRVHIVLDLPYAASYCMPIQSFGEKLGNVACPLLSTDRRLKTAHKLWAMRLQSIRVSS